MLGLAYFRRQHSPYLQAAGSRPRHDLLAQGGLATSRLSGEHDPGSRLAEQLDQMPYLRDPIHGDYHQ